MCTKNSPNQYFLLLASLFPTVKSGSRGGYTPPPLVVSRSNTPLKGGSKTGRGGGVGQWSRLQHRGLHCPTCQSSWLRELPLCSAQCSGCGLRQRPFRSPHPSLVHRPLSGLWGAGSRPRSPGGGGPHGSCCRSAGSLRGPIIGTSAHRHHFPEGDTETHEGARRSEAEFLGEPTLQGRLDPPAPPPGGSRGSLSLGSGPATWPREKGETRTLTGRGTEQSTTIATGSHH